MGRKEAQCLQILADDSMEKHITEGQPGLRKRNSIDSIDSLRQQTQRRNKSQQVRFKDDGTNKTHADTNGLDSWPISDTSVVREKALRPRLQNLSACSISFPKSKRALRNIAIQTSPSLRKHFPIFRKKIVMTNKSVKEVSLESKCGFQVNGNLYEQECMSTEHSHSRIANHIDEAVKPSKKGCKLKRKLHKGPVSLCSEIGRFLTLEKNTISTDIPARMHQNQPKKMELTGTVEKKLDCNSIHSSLGTTQSNLKGVCRRNTTQSSQNHVQCQSRATNTNKIETSPPNEDSDIERTRTPPCVSHKDTPQCFHKDHTQSAQSIKQPHKMTQNGNHPGLTPFNGSEKQQISATARKNISDTEKDSSVPSETSHHPNCEGGASIKPVFPRGKSSLNACKQIREMNQLHLTPTELCALQGKLKSIEESLNSNQQKIKVLLNVIQDLEKAKALSEGRKSYHTGQDLNNCSTCQSTACIIYSVEYDFRQQEGRFHPVLKTLDQVEQRSLSAPIQKTGPEDNPMLEKKDIQRKTKKVKKKCFWWL